MSLEVLISCMHEKDCSIVSRTNVQTDVVVVNQCDKDLVEEYTFVNKKNKECKAKFIHTRERGLSRSRNMALRNATAELCLICDDDEELVDDYETIIEEAFQNSKQADIIAFNITRPRRKPFKTIDILSYFEALKVSSVHITFRRNRVLEKNIQFDVLLGSGSGNGGGEDTRFMRDCKDNKLSIWSNPSYIGTLKNTGESLWFKGYDEKFFVDSGWSTRRVFGDCFSVFKLLHFAIIHWKEYKNNVGFFNAIKCSFVGWGQTRN